MAKVTQAHIEARTKEILDAATRMFARCGIENTTMQEIAREADLSAGAIYRYFPSKEELLRGVFADCTKQNRASFDRAAADADSPMQALRDVGRSAWGELKAEGAREAAMLSLETALAAARSPDELGVPRREMFTAQLDMLSGLIRQAQAVGEIDRNIDANAVALTLLAAYLGSMLLELQLNGNVDTFSVCSLMTDMLEQFAPKAN